MLVAADVENDVELTFESIAVEVVLAETVDLNVSSVAVALCFGVWAAGFYDLFAVNARM